VNNPYKVSFDEWESAGAIVPGRSVPEEVKWFVLLNEAEKNNHDTLIETGTATGDTLLHVYSFFNKIYSFELMQTYYEVAKRNTQNISHITLFNESSAGEQFASLINSLTGPALFYLDAHFSGEGTGQDNSLETPDVPVREELTIILESPYKHTIVIDDARVFQGEEFHSEEYAQYPSMEEIARFVKSKYTVRHEADSFILTHND